MAIRYVEVGFVSADESYLDFLADVFGLQLESTVEVPIGKVLKLSSAGGTVLKVFVPKETPKPAPEAGSFMAVEGIRFLSIRVDDLDGVLERALARGAQIVHPLRDAGSVRVAMFSDPRGNAIEVSEEKA